MTIGRAARAIFLSRSGDLTGNMTKVEARIYARASLGAIAEATPEMIEAGAEHWPDNDWSKVNSAACWRAMHAAMMKEGK